MEGRPCFASGRKSNLTSHLFFVVLRETSQRIAYSVTCLEMLSSFFNVTFIIIEVIIIIINYSYNYNYNYKCCHHHCMIFYYIDKSVLVENRPVLKFIRNYIRDSSGVFSISSLVRISMTSFPSFTLLFMQNYSCYIIKRKLHCGLKMWILFSRGKKQYFTHSLRSFVKYCFYHSKIKFINFAPPCNILYVLQAAENGLA